MREPALHEVVETDVAVIGAGGAGLSAAIEARKIGVEVIVLSRVGKLANNTAIAGGVFPLVNTPIQRERGIQDSADLLAKDLLRANGHTVDEDLIRTAADEAAKLYDWLTGFGVQFRDLVKFHGHSVPRCHVEAAWNGANVLTALLEAAKKTGVDLRHGCPATDLVMSDNGAVAGLRALNTEGRPVQIKTRRGVVLAAGGFGRDKVMMRQYAPEFAGLPVLSASGSSGDGIRMALAAGAQLDNMDSLVMYGAAEMKKKRTVFWAFILEGGILVNKNGERFVDESIGYARTAAPVARQSDGMAFMVFDEKIKTRVGKLDSRRSVETYVKDGVVIDDPTIGRLASKMGVDGQALEKTLAKLQFQDRLYAIPVRPCIIQTHGGVRIDSSARVMHEKGHPIPGLYAAGDNAAGLAGPATEEGGCSGYMTGTGYLDAFAFGCIAGRNVATEKPR